MKRLGFQLRLLYTQHFVVDGVLTLRALHDVLHTKKIEVIIRETHRPYGPRKGGCSGVPGLSYSDRLQWHYFRPNHTQDCKL